MREKDTTGETNVTAVWGTIYQFLKKWSGENFD